MANAICMRARLVSSLWPANSEVSQIYLRSKLANFGDRFDILLTDFYNFEPRRRSTRSSSWA
jgi:hypothetical protein